MSYKIRLKTIKGDETEYFDLINLATSASIASFKTDYKIKDGNRQAGIIQGIGLTNAGRTLSFAIPIFETASEDDIYKQIAKYTSILTNSYSYSFFIEHNIDNFWYSAQVQISETNSYSVDLRNYIKGFGFKCIMIENFFSGEDVSDNIGLIGGGLQTIDYTSKSLVPANINFEWNIFGEFATWEAFIQHNENYGLNFNASLGGGSFKIEYDGNILTYTKQGDDEKILLDYEGVQPFLDVNNNKLTIYSNYNTSSFIIKYKKGIAL